MRRKSQTAKDASKTSEKKTLLMESTTTLHSESDSLGEFVAVQGSKIWEIASMLSAATKAMIGEFDFEINCFASRKDDGTVEVVMFSRR